MNTENNKRYQETDEKIIKAFGQLAATKALTKITVSDVCKKANIHRTTFYGHFQDVIELQNKVEQLQFEKFMNEFIINESWDIHEGILQQTKFYYKYRQIIKRHLTQDVDWSSINFFPSGLLGMQEDYMRNFGCKTDTELKYHQIFFQKGFASVILQWVLEDCPESPEEIADLLVKIFEDATYKYKN